MNIPLDLTANLSFHTVAVNVFVQNSQISSILPSQMLILHNWHSHKKALRPEAGEPGVFA
jgi:hypothetical protein